MKDKKNKKENRGGLRPTNPGGRPKKAAKRVTVSVCLDPENLDYRKQIGRGWNDWINELIHVSKREVFEAIAGEDIESGDAILVDAQGYAHIINGSNYDQEGRSGYAIRGTNKGKKIEAIDRAA